MKGHLEGGDPADAVEALLRRFESYAPGVDCADLPFWPPRVRPARWNGNRRDVSADAIHYSRAETAALLCRMEALGVGRHRVLVSDFYSGLSCVLWRERFEEVFTLSVRPHQQRQFSDGRVSIFFGQVGDMPFLYEAASRMGQLDALLIDGTVRYSLVMTLYFTFRRLVAPGGVVVFFNTRDDGDPTNRVGRFLDDLRSGEADGIIHTIEDLNTPDGSGIALELVGSGQP